MVENQEKLNRQLFDVLTNNKTPMDVKIKKAKFLARLGADVNASLKGDFNINTRVAFVILRKLKFKDKAEKKKMFKLLLDLGLDVKLDENDSEFIPSLLREAIKQNDEDFVKFILDSGAEVNEVDKYGRSPLSDGVMGGNLNIVKALISKGADIDLCDSDGDSMLGIAIMHQRPEVMEFLISKGQKLDHVNFHGESILTLAIKHGRIEELEVLVKHGVELNGRENVLEYVAAVGNLEKASFLIDNGADANGKRVYWDQKTPLMQAVRGEHLDMVKLLVEKGADLEENRGYGKGYLLELAIDYENVKILEYLLSVGVCDKDNKWAENTLLMSSLDCAQCYDLIDCLVKGGIDVNAQNKDGRTVLMKAVKRDDDKLIKQLLDLGADVDIVDKTNRKAIDYAKDEVKYLIVNEKIKKRFKNVKESIKSFFKSDDINER